MSRIDKVISRIRFELEQLSARNGHHEFEHICRYLAGARICSNILPATGPVSAGGDQGRDFESFRSYLKKSALSDSTFIGLVSSEFVVFSCTIQKKKISSKIKSDITTIMSCNKKPDSIHFFCTTDIPVATRHKLQQWAYERHNAQLEIYDGQALSELLSGRDVFWIAEKYLSIDSEVYPPPPVTNAPSWYNSHLSEWRENTNSPVNYSDFFEIKSAIRYAR